MPQGRSSGNGNEPESDDDCEEVASKNDEDSDDDKGPTAQVDPLELRFSQKKMRNVFADGRLIADAVDQVRAVRRPPDEVEIYGTQWRLEASFPPIEVIRWRCKIRDDTTGRPLVNPETGEQMFEPEESWFSLDNRRLWCLQQAAVQLFPERCTADVIIEIRKDRRLREIRKFRTLDSGKSINVGSRVDGVPFVRWCWSTALKKNDKNEGKNGRGSRKGKGGGRDSMHNHKGNCVDDVSGQTNKGKGRSAKGGKDAGRKGDGKGKGKGGKSKSTSGNAVAGKGYTQAGQKGGRGRGGKTSPNDLSGDQQ